MQIKRRNHQAMRQNIRTITIWLDKRLGHYYKSRYVYNSIQRVVPKSRVLAFLLAASVVYFPLTASAATGSIYANGDVTAGWANCTNSCASHYTEIDETTYDATDYVSTGTAGSGGEIEEFNMTAVAGVTDTVTSVQVFYNAWANGGCNSTCDDIDFDMSIEGTYQGVKTYTLTGSDPGEQSLTAWTGTWTGDEDIIIKATRIRQGSGNPGNQDDDALVARIRVLVTYTSSADVQQTHFRWRDDTEGLDVAPTWLAAEDNSGIGDITIGLNYRLRLEAANNSAATAANNYTYRLEYGTIGASCAAATGWTRIDTASDAFEMVDTTYYTNEESLDTTRLTASEVTFVAGDGNDTDDESGLTSLAVDEYTEMEYSIRATSSAVAGTTYCFRMTNGGTVLDAYSVYPQVTIKTPGPPLLTQEDYIFENDDGEAVGSSAPNLGPVDVGAGGVPASARSVVQTSTGDLYALIQDTSTCEIWKSIDDGTSWTEQDTADNPACTGSYTASLAIDSSDDLHFVYVSTGATTLYYMKYTSSTDQFGTQATIATSTDLLRDPNIAIDSSDVPHVVWADEEFQGGGYDNWVYYINKVGGSWNTKVIVETAALLDGANYENADIAISEDDVPEIVYYDVDAIDIAAEVGNVNNATSFTKQILDTTPFANSAASIAVDASGNTWVAYKDENGASDYITLIKHNDADAWTTWQASTNNTNVGTEPSVTVDGTDTYIFYIDDNSDVVYDVYDTTWAGETTLHTGTFADVNVRYSNYNMSDPAELDYVYDGGANVAWGRIGGTLAPAEASAQAGSLFSSPKTRTQVRVGERTNLRIHPKNTGDTAITSTDQLALFYDRNDGLWTKVGNNVTADTAAGNCDSDTNFSCTTVASTDSVGQESSMAIAPDGSIWVAYRDTTASDLVVARYVGSGGSGCASTAWSCETVHATGSVGYGISIAINSAGKVYIAHGSNAAQDLFVAEYVGSGGDCDTSYAGSDAWTCTLVEDTQGNINYATSIAFASDGSPWIAYSGSYDTGCTFFICASYLAQYVGGASGSGCTDSDWDGCSVIDGGLGESRQIKGLAFSPDDEAWITVYDTDNSRLVLSQNIGGTSGSCTDTSWDCEVIDDVGATAGVGGNSSIAFSPSGDAWISYEDIDNSDLKVAHQVSSSGTGCTGATNSTQWVCETVDATGSVGAFGTSIAFSPDGNAWVSYHDNNATATNRALKLTRYVGTSGSGCNVTTWECGTIDSAGADSIGLYSSLAFAANGNAWMSYFDGGSEGDLRVAQLTRAGEILATTSQQLDNNTSLTESHADMTSESDSSNRDSADCVTAGAVWNNGVYSGTENLTGLSLPAGDVTVQCTELMWTLDTSQATPGETYRFIVATEDNWRSDKGPWRGPGTIDEYPTITISSDYTNRFAKDAFYEMADCTDTDWGCDTILSDNSAGLYSNIAVDPSGTPWVAFSESASDNLWVAKYVGSGGNCDDVAGSDAWDCTLVDASDTQFVYASIAFELDGTAWVSYYGAGADVELAKYVGSGGTGCTSSAWTCVELDTGNLEGGYSSLVIDKGGIPWLSFYSGAGATCDDSPTDECSLKVARYVGSDGTGCDATTEWTCEIIENPTTTGAIGEYTSIALDGNGSPWVSYYDVTNTNLKLARYVGSGGSGCTSSSWTCITVDSSDTGEDGYGGTSLAFDAAGNAWISYQARPSGTLYGLKVATNKTSPGFGSACTASGWVCGDVDDSTRAVGWYSSIAFDAEGVDPWISAWVGDSGGDGCNDSPTNECSLAVIKFVGSGGSSPCNSEWRCEIVDNPTSTGNVGQYTSIAFDNSGSTWVSYYDATNTALKIAKTHMSQGPLSASVSNTFSHRNAGSGDARYPLTSGSGTIDTKPDCTTVDNYEGYCGVRENDGNFDSIVADASERVLFTAAFYSYQNTELSSFIWRGNTTLAPSTGNLGLEVYRFGTTNAWESLDTDTVSSDCSTVQCSLNGLPSGTATEYFESDGGSGYWIYVRVYQKAGTASYTFKTDSFQRSQTLSFMRHGAAFEDRVLSPFRY